MSTPLPTASVEPLPKADDSGTPYADYVRKIEFLDSHPVAPDEPPVHVLGRQILLDGVGTTAAIGKEGVTVDLGEGGTVVTMHVWHEDVQIGTAERPSGEGHVPFLIGGRHVLTPVGEGWAWEPVDEGGEWIVCSIYVAEVHVR